MKIAKILSTLLMVFLFSCGDSCDSKDLRYYVLLHTIDKNKLPSPELFIECNGRIVWEANCNEMNKNNDISSNACIPESATIAFIYSADILVATNTLTGFRGGSNAIVAGPIPHPDVYKGKHSAD